MNRKLTILLLFALSFILSFLAFPKSTQAEIATVRDWIGLFVKDAPGNSKSDTVPTGGLPDQRSWKYTYNCSQTIPPPDAKPSLKNPNGCEFPRPPDGNYEFRLYANDKEDLDALVAKSSVFNVGAPNPNSEYVPTKGKLYSITGNLTLNSNITPVDVTGVIFVDGDLNINTDLINANGKTGLVFVVKGDVLIDKAVKRIDAVIISSGIIYTATDKSATPSPTTTCEKNLVNVGASTNALTINGSLISLDPGTIVFCRTLTTNSEAAEKIVHQIKYLVILRNLFADTLLKWTEVTAGGSAVSTVCSEIINDVFCNNAGCEWNYLPGPDYGCH